MYKVLLVDDEILAIQFLERLVNWEKLSCQVVGFATTVRKALRLARELRPDIVFMDIKMPGMDGLEVTERILAEAKDTAIIILTAYPDFEFAQKALKLGVLDFLIKHELDEDMVKDAVKKAVSEIQRKEQVNRVLTERWMSEGWAEKTELSTPRKLTELTGTFRLLMVKPQSLCLKSEDCPLEEWTENVCSPSVRGGFYEKPDVSIFLIEAEAVRSENGKRWSFRETADSLLESGGHLKDFSLLGIYSEEFSDIRKYREICLKLKCFQHMTPYQTHHLLFPEDYKKLSVITPQWPQSAADKLYDRMAENPVELRKLVKTVFGTESGDFWIDTEELKPFGELLGKCGKDWELLRKIRSVAEFLKTAAELKEELAVRHGEKNEKVIQAEAYIREHFGENIGSTLIGEVLHVSDGYLRKIFKQETGLTLKEYLQDFRIRKAREYLESGQYRVSEIAQMCGFKSSQHFSTVFKNIVGKSPGAYTGDGNKEHN